MSDIIVDILERNLTGPRYHNESKSQICFDCPVCSNEKGKPEGDGKGNLEVNYELGVFKCWACWERNGTSGTILKLLNKFGTNKDIEEYKRFVPRYEFSSPFDHQNKKPQKKYVSSLPDDFNLLKFDKRSEIANKCFYYLNAVRGIDEELIYKYNAGYVDKGFFHDRLVIPSYDKNGVINYYVTRAFGNVKPKYLNPSANKEDIIFNEYYLKYDFPIHIVEGVFDHMVTPNSIPLLGLEMSDYVFEKLYYNASSYVVIFLDGEAYNEAISLYNKLNVGRLLGRVKLIELPYDMDPSDYYKEKGAKEFFKKLGESKFI